MPNRDTLETQIALPTLDALDALARVLAGQLAPGDVLALNGPMGAGKTTLVQHLGRYLGIQEPITSPTFTLIHHYLSGKIPLVHLDFYRLGDVPDGGTDSLAVEVMDLVDAGTCILVAEWADLADFLAPVTSYALTLDYAPKGEGRVARLQFLKDEDPVFNPHDN